MATKGLHYQCRNTKYPAKEDIFRFIVPDAQVSWDVPFGSYDPVDYTAPSVLTAPWADKFAQ